MVRTVTNAIVALTLLLVVTWPLELRDRPTRRDPLPVRRAFAARLALHTGSIALLLVASGVGAALYSRQAKEEYRREALRNMKNLVEGEEEEPLAPPGERGRGEGP